MAAVAPAPAGAAIQQDAGIRSEDWPEDINQPVSRDSDRVLFNQDGLNTGVKVMGQWGA